MHVADLDGAAFPDGDYWRAFLVVAASDADGVPVSGATIAMSVWSEGNLWAKTICTTDARGRCVVSPSVRPLVTGIAFRVEGMAHSNFVYQPAHNTDPDADSDGTFIKISRPW